MPTVTAVADAPFGSLSASILAVIYNKPLREKNSNFTYEFNYHHFNNGFVYSKNVHFRPAFLTASIQGRGSNTIDAQTDLEATNTPEITTSWQKLGDLDCSTATPNAYLNVVDKLFLYYRVKCVAFTDTGTNPEDKDGEVVVTLNGV